MTNEELEQKVKRLEEQLTEVRIELLERKTPFIPYKPYEVEVPDDIGNYYHVDETGEINQIGEVLNYYDFEQAYLRGLAFKTKEEAEQFDKERVLLFKLRKWAEEHNEGWTPNWNDYNEEKWTVMYHNECEEFEIHENYRYREFLKLPYFESEEIAKQFIEEFGDEIKEVLC